jgi:hypothetical protein
LANRAAANVQHFAVSATLVDIVFQLVVVGAGST